MKGTSFYRVSIWKLIRFIFLLVVLVAAGGVAMLRLAPGAGAYGADALRKYLGDKPVALLEMSLMQVQDKVQSLEYHLGLSKPGNPFEPAAPAGQASAGNQPAKHLTLISGPSISGLSRGNTSQPADVDHRSAQLPKANLLPVTGANAGAWALPVISGQSGKYGNGSWEPYLTNAAGQVVAYRTYVQPDPTRPYTYAAIIAFDLRHTGLHYVIGSEEPYAPGVRKTSPGVIPEADLQSGAVLAAFNGGFKYEHGHFGSMANGLVSAPALNGMGTVALYRDGSIKIGEWGKDILPSPELLAYRQNGPLAVQDGAVNPLVDQSRLWGLTLSGGTVTQRSGLAISADGRTLYYFAGYYITAPILASAMATVHPKAAVQLDINDYWVYFTDIHTQDGHITASPLLPKAMIGDSSRFLKPYTRDFFYITQN